MSKEKASFLQNQSCVEFQYIVDLLMECIRPESMLALSRLLIA